MRRIGVDIGGTFTDMVVYDGATGRLSASKLPTTPAAPERAVMALMEELSDDELHDTELFLHGTTVGLNALLVGNGARVGLLTTAGFRDILEVRRGDREEIFNLHWRPAPALVPRSLRLPITERMRADGQVERELLAADVVEAARSFGAAGVEVIAVVFLNAYRNPSHELEAETLLRGCGYSGDVVLAHQLSGEYREFERTATTVVDAYIRPCVRTYLRRLEAGVREQGFSGTTLVTRSGGGAMTFASAAERPFETIMSGPVAAAMGTAALARELGLDETIMADVGGTSFDTCLILDGTPTMKYEGTVAGLPLQCPWIDVRSIGAGGGSIAAVGAAGRLAVGPTSAGADPGPACYGRGGTAATATDAACHLGMLPGELAGNVVLDRELSAAALQRLGEELSLSVEQVAEGVIVILAATMANAIRSVTIEQGHDPRDARLLAFGGAGPLFAGLLARELEIRETIIPAFPGNFSAVGLLRQDIVLSRARTILHPLDGLGLELVDAAARDMIDELRGSLGTGVPVGAVEFELAIDLRYLGQEYTLTLELGEADGRRASAERVAARFQERYRRTFGHVLDEPVEVVVARASRRERLSEAGIGQLEGSPMTESAFMTPIWSFAERNVIPFEVVERSSLSAGHTHDGPLVLTEATATTYVDTGFSIEAGETGTLHMMDNDRPPHRSGNQRPADTQSRR